MVDVQQVNVIVVDSDCTEMCQQKGISFDFSGLILVYQLDCVGLKSPEFCRIGTNGRTTKTLL
jgi:hypothetical protein